MNHLRIFVWLDLLGVVVCLVLTVYFFFGGNPEAGFAWIAASCGFGSAYVSDRHLRWIEGIES